MAEERLIDDDKDRKYKIRVNADGEEELVIDDSPEEEEEEQIGFAVPELEDDEEAAVMTPEQLALREQARKEAEEKRAKSLAETCERAKSLISEQKYEEAGYILEDVDGAEESGEAQLLRLCAITRGFTDFSDSANGATVLARINERADGAQKAEYAQYIPQIEEAQRALDKEVTELNARNVDAREARKQKFTAKKSKAVKLFAGTGVPLVLFAVLAIVFGTMMHADKAGTFMILFIVFVSLAGALLVATLITAHMLWDSSKLLKLNTKNSSSKLGREFESKNAELKLVNGIYEALNLQNDIS